MEEWTLVRKGKECRGVNFGEEVGTKTAEAGTRSGVLAHKEEADDLGSKNETRSASEREKLAFDHNNPRYSWIR